jgi:hypothetical protein
MVINEKNSGTLTSSDFGENVCDRTTVEVSGQRNVCLQGIFSKQIKCQLVSVLTI